MKIWDVKTGQLERTIPGAATWQVDFSPDGTRIASGSVDNTVKVWDAATGQETLTLKGHTRGVLSVSFSIDNIPPPGGDARTIGFWKNWTSCDGNGNQDPVLYETLAAAGGTILEVPAGKIDPGDTPETCAARELEEEAGQRAGRIEKLGWIFTTPGFTDEVIHLFAAFELETVPTRHEDDEVIEVVPTPIGEALELIWSGELRDAKSVVALIHAAKGHKQKRLFTVIPLGVILRFEPS